MKKLLSALVALSLTGCATFPAVPTFNPHDQIAPTINKAAPALAAAWHGYDALVTSVNALRAAGIIHDGSPRANHIADVLEGLLHALDAATDAIKAGNATNFADAMNQAQQAFTAANLAIGGS
jgi:hypothetical protein